MKVLHVIAMLLLLIGGLNWGLIGLSGYNFIDSIFSARPVFDNVVYILFGLSALFIIFEKFKRKSS
jgi:uncharacterized protein